MSDARPEDLRYAATARCKCGAGMAYRSGKDNAWYCSKLLLGEMTPVASTLQIPFCPEPEGIHTAGYPFAFYEIKSEIQPSAQGATTRPPKVAP